MKRILITGANGFIAHHLVKYFHKLGWDVYANYRCEDNRIIEGVKKIRFDLNNILPDIPKLDYIIHTAALTQVDESLKDVIPFIRDNVLATGYLLEWIKKEQSQARVCLFSSDEVLGPADPGIYFKEDAPLKPSNPYAATKASQEMLVHSFVKSFGLNIFTIRCMNVIGEGESKNKFIGLVLDSIKNNKKIILHGTSKDNIASRHWVYAGDVAKDIHFLLENGNLETYHIAGEELDVYSLASKIFYQIKGKPISAEDVEFIDFHKARPGHDKRYSLDNSKLTRLTKRKYTPLDEVLRRITNEN